MINRNINILLTLLFYLFIIALGYPEYAISSQSTTSTLDLEERKIVEIFHKIQQNETRLNGMEELETFINKHKIEKNRYYWFALLKKAKGLIRMEKYDEAISICNYMLNNKDSALSSDPIMVENLKKQSEGLPPDIEYTIVINSQLMRCFRKMDKKKEQLEIIESFKKTLLDLLNKYKSQNEKYKEEYKELPKAIEMKLKQLEIDFQNLKEN